LLHIAKQTLDVCVYTITDDRLAHALAAARQRGVVVRLITDDDKVDDIGSDIHFLKNHGVDVRIDNNVALMHHKFCIVDKRILVNGSFNWTRSASTVNRENIIVTDDVVLVNGFIKEFQDLWERYQANYLPDGYIKRPNSFTFPVRVNTTINQSISPIPPYLITPGGPPSILPISPRQPYAPSSPYHVSPIYSPVVANFTGLTYTQTSPYQAYSSPQSYPIPPTSPLQLPTSAIAINSYFSHPPSPYHAPPTSPYGQVLISPSSSPQKSSTVQPIQITAHTAANFLAVTQIPTSPASPKQTNNRSNSTVW